MARGGDPSGTEPEGQDIAAAADAAGVDTPAAKAVAESLFERTGDAVDTDNPFGRPGPALSRSGAFYRGFLTTLGVLIALAIGFAVRDVQSVLILILVSMFLAVGLNPIVELLMRRGIHRRWAVLIVTVAVLGVLTVVVAVLVGVLSNQLSSFVDDLPHLVNDLRRHRSIRQLDNRYHFLATLQDKLQDPNLMRRIFGGAFNVGLTVLGAVVNTFVIIVMTVYFLAALPQTKRTAYALAPASRRDRVAQLGDEILRRVGGYVIGAVLVALLAGTVTLILLFCVGLGQYALPLAFVVALLDLVPLVGSITGAATVTVIALATSLHTGLIVLLVYVIYEPIEGYVVYPRVMRSSVDVPEIMTIVAVLIGGSLGGIVGALLALPTAAAVKLLVQEVWVRRQDAT